MNAENHSTLDATAIVSFYTEMSKKSSNFLWKLYLAYVRIWI